MNSFLEETSLLGSLGPIFSFFFLFQMTDFLIMAKWSLSFPMGQRKFKVQTTFQTFPCILICPHLTLGVLPLVTSTLEVGIKVDFQLTQIQHFYTTRINADSEVLS